MEAPRSVLSTLKATASLLAVFVVTGTADQLRNEFRARGLRNHVVVCGLGSVGTAVARDQAMTKPRRKATSEKFAGWQEAKYASCGGPNGIAAA